MNKNIPSLFRESLNDQEKLSKIESVFSLYEKLKDTYDLETFFEELQQWLIDEYTIHHLKISLLNTRTELEEVIYHRGKEFDRTSSLIKEFTIAVHPYLNANILILGDNEEHYQSIEDSIEYFNLFFYELSPLLKSVIMHKELKYESYKDSVTGLYNRVYLIEHLKKMLPLASRENKKVGFLMVGIDHFKAVIDEFDYNIGDRVLVELSKSISLNIRESDIVVRLDSDEFLVVLANVADEESSIMVGKKLVKSFAKCEVDVNAYTGQTLKKTICVGISMYPDDSTSIDQVLKNADISLYEARNMGRSQVLRYEKDQDSSVDLF